MSKNIISTHSFDEYEKKYRKFNYRLLSFSKKYVEEYDRKNKTTQKNYLLKGRKWWLIDDNYYEVPKPPRFTWLINTNRVARYSAYTLLVGGITCAIVLPQVFKPSEMKSNIDRIHILLKKNEENVHTCYDAINLIKDNLKIDIETANTETSEEEYVFDSNKKEVVVIKGDDLVYGPSGYSLSAKNHIWKFVSTIDSTTEYSQYLKDSVNAVSDISVISGLDVGNHNEVRAIHYKNDTDVGKEVIFRTFDYSSNASTPTVNLTIRANNDETNGDTINHYGDVANLYIVSNAMRSYHEYGEVTWAEVYEGALNLSANKDYKGDDNIGIIKNVEVKATTTDTVKLDVSGGGTVKEVLTTSEDVAKEMSKQTGKTITAKTEQEIKKQKVEEFKDTDVSVGNINVYNDTTNELVNYFTSLTELSDDSNGVEDGEVKTYAGQTVKLSCDYDMSDDCAYGWTPICNDTTSYTGSFAGTFDGGSHTISNFNVTTSMSGLFASTRGDLKNVNFKDCNHTCPSSETAVLGNALLASLLVGNANVSNVHCENCKVIANGSSGFIVSWIDSVAANLETHSFTNCSTDEKCVAYNTGGNQMGGILGQCCYAAKVEFKNCTNNAAVSGKGAVGGIIGQYGAGTPVGVFDHCINNGKITLLGESTGGGLYAGGLVGYHNNASVTGSETNVSYIDCENNGIVTSVQTDVYPGHITRESTSVGGFVGYSNGFNVSFTRCKNTGDIGLIKDHEENYWCFKAAGFLAFNNGDLSETFTECDNSGSIHATVGVGHFSALLTSSSEKPQKAINCTHSGTLIDADKRVQIEGEN